MSQRETLMLFMVTKSKYWNMSEWLQPRVYYTATAAALHFPQAINYKARNVDFCSNIHIKVIFRMD